MYSINNTDIFTNSFYKFKIIGNFKYLTVIYFIFIVIGPCCVRLNYISK